MTHVAVGTWALDGNSQRVHAFPRSHGARARRRLTGEMEDYEPVEEENSDDAESSIADVVDSA